MKKRGRNDEEEEGTMSLVMEWPWLRRPPRAWKLNEMCLCGNKVPFIMCEGACPRDSIWTGSTGPFRLDPCVLPIHHGDILIDRNSPKIGLVEGLACTNNVYYIWHIEWPVYMNFCPLVVPSHMVLPGHVEVFRAEFGTYLRVYDPGPAAWERNAEKRRYQARTYTFVLCLLCRLGFSKDLRSLIAPLVFAS